MPQIFNAVIETAVKKTARWAVFKRGVPVSAEAHRAIRHLHQSLKTLIELNYQGLSYVFRLCKTDKLAVIVIKRKRIGDNIVYACVMWIATLL